jgi:hypothetical protein
VPDHHFFVQETTKERWHVETDENCEVMLCGKVISVDSSTARVSHRWGQRKCPDCWMRLEALHKVEAIGPHLSSRRALSQRPLLS